MDEQHSSSRDAARAAAEKASNFLLNENYTEALRQLTFGFQQDVDFQPLYRVATQCLQAIDGQEEAQLFGAAADAPTSYATFSALGNHFYLMEHYDLAIPFLAKAHRLQPQQRESAHNLAVAYARRFRIEEALQILESINPMEDFWSCYYWCKLRVLQQRTEGVSDALAALRRVIEEHPKPEELEIARLKVQEVTYALQRLQQIGTPRAHIQDWQFVQYGGMMLDFFEESDKYVAGGRYVAAWGDAASIKEILLRLADLLEKLQHAVGRVYFTGERDDAIVGMACAKILDVPSSALGELPLPSDALLVAADSASFGQVPATEDPSQVPLLFAFNHSWLQAAYVSPDIIGLMSQSYYFPWEEGRPVLDPTTRKVTQSGADPRPAAEIAEEIAAAQTSGAGSAIGMELYRQQRDYLSSIGSQAAEKRVNFMPESPLPGAFFS